MPAPKTVQDLLKPEYKGKVALNGDPTQAAAGYHGVMMASLGNGGSADDISKGVEFFKQLKAAGNLELPVVASNDVHFMTKDDGIAQLYLECVGKGRTFAEEQPLHHNSFEMYLKTPDEMADWLEPLAEAGVDVFHCSQRRFWEPDFPEVDGKDGLSFAGWAKKLTGVATINVGSVGLSGDMLSTFSGEGSNPASLERLIERMERGEFDLIAVGRALLNDAAGPRDLPCRVAGGRFGVLVSEGDGRDAEALFERLQALLRERPLPDVGAVTVSGGIAELLPTDDGAALVVRADAALGLAKGSGRDTVVTAARR